MRLHFQAALEGVDGAIVVVACLAGEGEVEVVVRQLLARYCALDHLFGLLGFALQQAGDTA